MKKLFLSLTLLLFFSNIVSAEDTSLTTIPKKTLEWQINKPNKMKCQFAIEYCENLSLNGKDDWRLPSIDELQIIVDHHKFHPAIDILKFPFTISSNYWSSTTYSRDSSYAWLINFKIGNVGVYDKNYKYYVRYVRGGQ